jgi:hypothetical protein
LADFCQRKPTLKKPASPFLQTPAYVRQSQLRDLQMIVACLQIKIKARKRMNNFSKWQNDMKK